MSQISAISKSSQNLPAVLVPNSKRFENIIIIVINIFVINNYVVCMSMWCFSLTEANEDITRHVGVVTLNAPSILREFDLSESESAVSKLDAATSAARLLIVSWTSSTWPANVKSVRKFCYQSVNQNTFIKCQ